MRGALAATIGLSVVLGSAAPAVGQSVPAGADPGIGAVPSASPPPPVTTMPVPSNPVTPGSTYTPYPTIPTVAPSSSPAVPQLGPAQAPLPNATAPSVTTDENAAPRPATAGPPAPAGTKVVSNGGLDMVSAFQLGRENDATFRAAVAERQVNMQTAGQTIAAYLPSASYAYQNIPTESGSRHVATVTQPLISLSGLATLKQRKPRRAYAEATFDVREQDLATRTATAIIDIVRASEAITLNEARIDAFRTQSDRADRLYKSGLGTVTDARDIQVRYQQSLANRILLKSDRIAAAARLRSITGVEPPVNAFHLPDHFGAIALGKLDDYIAEQSSGNPQIEAARQTERISKLEAQRVKGSILPVVGASATYSKQNDNSYSYVGLSLSAPLNAGTFFQAGAANATARRSFEERRQVEEKARTELERLYALVDGGQQALAISATSIEAAELSVQANTKSYEGGVRTSVDVVNAIQTYFEVKNAYVQAATTVASNYLNLQLLAGVAPEEAMVETQAFLLGRR